MADRIITVTSPSVVTNDTLASYNNYSDIDGLLGSMTIGEAAAGKTVSLSDGATHQVTTKPVGTTNGEFSAVVSNAVTVDLSGGAEADMTFQSGNLLNISQAGTVYTVDSGADWASNVGLADETLTGNGYIASDIVGVTLNDSPLLKFRDTNVNEVYTVAEGVLVFVNSTQYYTLEIGTSAQASGINALAGDRVRIIRAGTNIKAEYYRGGTWQLIRDFGDATSMATGTCYLQIAGNGAGRKIDNPKVFIG